MEKEFLLDYVKSIKSDYGHKCTGVSQEKLREYKEVVRELSNIIFSLHEENESFLFEMKRKEEKILELESFLDSFSNKSLIDKKVLFK